MKQFALFILSFMVLSLVATAQEDREGEQIQTLLGENVTFTGFGGPWMYFTSVNDQFTHMMGGGGGVLINNALYFGGYGYGNTNPVDYNLDELEFGYGGLMAGYIHNHYEAIHPAFGLMIGWGSLELKDTETKDNVFVLHPMAEMEMNITRFFKIGVGAGYQYVSNIDRFSDLKDKDLSSLSGRLSFYFGWF